MAASSSSSASGNKRLATNDESSLSSSKTLKLCSPASASGGSSRWKYDVFLSFRGVDTRNNFTDHLYAELDRKSIHTFKDDERLETGTEISSKIIEAIEESQFFIVIFSKNFAYSTFCLEELSKMVEFSETNNNHTVIPIFYNVDPSDVRKQEGEFKKAFDQHQQNHDNEKVQRWRASLIQIANFVGYPSRGRRETKLIGDIVNDIWNGLDFSSSDGDQRSRNLVGMDFHWEKMEALLEAESDKVHFIGICGMDGIGKTIIARYVYDKISNEYDGRCFLENVRHVKRKNFVDLQKTLLSSIVGEKNLNVPNDHEAAAKLIRNRLCRKRIILVLDDVDIFEQLEMLAGNHNWFGSRSRIIITARDHRVLRSNGRIRIYEVEGLKDDAALQLFHMNAFKNKQPEDSYIQLSTDIVHCVSGHPLALKVLGCHLCDRAVEEWNSALNRLRQVPTNAILETVRISYDRLKELEKEIFLVILETVRISYDGLKELEKEMFLEIVRFFKGKNKGWVSEKLDWGSDFHLNNGKLVLIERSLITMSSYKGLGMHDLLQEMGWAIVCEKNPDNRDKWSRLCRSEDVNHMLTENGGL